MQQLVYFIQRFKYFLFFLFLASIAIGLTLNNVAYQRSKFINSANSFTGGIYETTSNLSEYLNLKTNNKLLHEENEKLKNINSKLLALQDSSLIKTVDDSLVYHQKYTYLAANIINNNYHNTNNFLTINKGINDSIAKEMAVINNRGIIGIIDAVSNNYSRVQSVLNSKSKINARFKNNNQFGTLSWDGKDYNIVQLNDIPREAVYKTGDTIITGGKSTIFPEGVLIGSIVSSNEENKNTINIKLFNDMTNLRHVYVVINLDKQEILTLEQTNNE